MQNLNVRWATAEDADFVAETIREVSEGVIDYLFEGLFPGMSSTAVLKLVLGRGHEAYSYNHVLLTEVAGQIGGMIFAYDAKHQTVPAVMEGFLSKRRVDAVRPLLEAKYPNALWINTLWVSPEFRGQGLSGLILNLATDLARDTGFSSLALHCWMDNECARRFYEKQGFRVVSKIPTGDKLLERHPYGGECWVKPLTESASAALGLKLAPNSVSSSESA